jgi:hypothetical protein
LDWLGTSGTLPAERPRNQTVEVAHHARGRAPRSGHDPGGSGGHDLVSRAGIVEGCDDDDGDVSHVSLRAKTPAEGRAIDQR